MDSITDCPIDGSICYNWTAGEYDLEFERTITSIDGLKVTLDIPLVQSISADFGGGVVFKYTFAERPRLVGIEDLGFDSTYTSETDEQHGWNAVMLTRLEQGWVRRISCRHYGFACVNVGRRAKHITVSGCSSSQMISEIAGGRRYTFNVDGQMVLVTGCSAEDGRHDYVTGSRVAGPNVFHNCSASRAHSDVGPHHRWGVGQLYDRVVSDNAGRVWNRGNSGSGHGWSGAQVVFWNSEFSSMLVEAAPGSRNWAVGCKVSGFDPYADEPESSIDAVSTGRCAVGSVVGEWDSVNQEVEPFSLYEAQLSEAMATSPTTTTTTATTTVANQAAATGDPHLQNVHGERFDLAKPGKHVLLNIPRGTDAKSSLLRVEADARQLGGRCTDMYFKSLNVTGAWADKKHAGGYRYESEGVVKETPAWVAFGRVELKVVRGHAEQGITYLNFYVKNLRRTGFVVGGLLGEDDFSEAAKPVAACMRRMDLERKTADMRDRSSPAFSSAAASF
mmetsp:Transcript_34233/g.90841  ORF Transcript_34233/g.90841 Transcript_34233/m.90841 type:complete len:504 (-) Transcript_34233:146-1657(-)